MAVDPIERTGSGRVGDRSANGPAAHHPRQAHPAHQPRHRASRGHDPLPGQLPPDLPHAVDAEVGLEHTLDLDHQRGVTARTNRLLVRIGAPGGMRVVGRRGDRQHPADRPHPEALEGRPRRPPVLVDEADHGETGGRAPPWRNTRSPCAGSRLAWRSSRSLSLERLDPLALVRRLAGTHALIPLGLAHPVPQRLAPEQPILAAIDWIADHCEPCSPSCSRTIRPTRTLAHLGRKRGCSLRHGSILSEVGASEKPERFTPCRPVSASLSRDSRCAAPSAPGLLAVGGTGQAGYLQFHQALRGKSRSSRAARPRSALFSASARKLIPASVIGGLPGSALVSATRS